MSSVKALTPATTHSAWAVERSPVQKPGAHCWLTGLWVSLKGGKGPHIYLALVKASQWISLANMGPVRTAMGISRLSTAHHAHSSRNSSGRVLPSPHCNAKAHQEAKTPLDTFSPTLHIKLLPCPKTSLSPSTRPCLSSW